MIVTGEGQGGKQKSTIKKLAHLFLTDNVVLSLSRSFHHVANANASINDSQEGLEFRAALPSHQRKAQTAA